MNNNKFIDPNWVNVGKKGKIEYSCEYGIVIPVCPFCNEPAYEEEQCIFCGAKFEQPTKEEQEEVNKANHEFTVTYKNVTLHQIASAVYQYKNNRLISHWSLTRPYTEEELLAKAKRLAGD